MKAAKTPARRQAVATPAEPAATRHDVYQAVTDRICAALEGGQIPWLKGWNVEYGLPKNYATGHVYSGINAFLLAMSPVGDFPFFMTYNQAKEAGGQVRKGEKGERIVAAGFHEGKPKAGGAEGEKGDSYSYFREFVVFNISQIDGIDWVLPEVTRNEFTPNETAEALVNGYLSRPGAPSLTHGGSRACYWLDSDAIQMPPKITFRSTQAYYRTLLHELCHSTGAPQRLNREELVNSDGMGGQLYGREELTAEMGAAFLSAELGYAPEPEGDQHASYIQGWLKIISGDKKLVFAAAAAAQKAAYLIKGEQAPEYVRKERATA